MLECYLVCSSLKTKKYSAELYSLHFQPQERYFFKLYWKFRSNGNVSLKEFQKIIIKSKATEIAVVRYFETHPENSLPDIENDSNFSYG